MPSQSGTMWCGSITAVPEPSDAERLRLREAPADRPIMRQVWKHLGFLHWAVEPDVMARALPPGLQVDTFDGAAFLGIVPFTIPVSRMAGVGLPITPGFHELNVRTYVHREGREPGVWFFSLDAASQLAVWGARLAYGLPYFPARISMDVTGDRDSPTIAYTSRRERSGTEARFQARYGPMAAPFAAAPGTLEFFLVERYLLYAWRRQRLTTARVHHHPYPVQTATVADLEQTLLGAAGLPDVGGSPAYVHYAREVDVRIYRPHRVAG
ncbi:MAG TPA: DUF2071 domain-containing protein [Polyangia bacterium]|jgi:hypothetical protein